MKITKIQANKQDLVCDRFTIEHRGVTYRISETVDGKLEIQTSGRELRVYPCCANVINFVASED